ncbi:MAG: hypothetical protein JRG73_10565 [Deltaproteobacteria bacterium]|nr:hypothetical protein [Deltaproteobacteria bacterium]MBW2307367.1 hypothetical protein [Deltaproteobacteria bacterium]
MASIEKEIRSLERKIDAGSAAPEVYLRLAELYDASGKPHRAHAVLKRQLEKNVKPALAHFGIGMLHEKYGDEQAALYSYRQAADIDSTLRPALAAIRRINRVRIKRKIIAKIVGFGQWIVGNAGFLTIFVLTPLMILLVSLLAVDTAAGNSSPGLTLVIQRIAIFLVSFIGFFVVLKYYK